MSTIFIASCCVSIVSPPISNAEAAASSSRLKRRIRFAHASGRTELRALLRYTPFLQQLRSLVFAVNVNY